MKARVFPLKRILAFMLILATICSVFASCATNLDAEGSDSASDGLGADGSITIFANGAYQAKIIHDGTPIGKSVCEQLTKIISDFTGVPLTSEDSYAAYSGPAILVGETTYAESIAALSKLTGDQASASLSGNKYVVIFTSEELAEQLLNSFKSTLAAKASPTEIKINSDWTITAGASANKSTNKNTSASSNLTGNTTFDESTLKASATLPNLGTGYDAGQGSKTYIKKSATKSTFTTLCSDLEKNGFKKYTANSIGDNLFATYLTKAQIVHVMFFPNKSEIRTAVDKRGTGTSGFALAGLSGDNKYTKKTNPSLTLCEIENADWPGGLCMIYKLSDGRFFVVDSGIGGRSDNGGSSSGWIYASLAKHADDPKNIQVAAWLITHIHSDHAGGLYDMALGWYQKNGSSTKHKVMPQECTQWIKIDKIIYNAPKKLPDANRDGWMETIIKAFNVKNVVKAHPGQVFYISDLTLTIYASLDLIIEQSGIDNTNEHSVVSRAEFNGKTILMLGDTFPKVNKEIATIYKDLLKSDVLQVAHHGYDNTDAATVNKYCNPSIVLWPVSTGDMRREGVLKANVNVPLKGKTNYTPHGGNVVLDHNWKKSMISNSTILNMIPKCTCGCGKKSSYSPKYDSNCPCGCQK